MTNLSIGHAYIQPDAHHLCITIILGILARFHPEDRWSRGWGRLTPCTSSKRIPRVVSVSVYFFLSFFSFFFLHRKGFYREGNPLGLNHSNNTFASLLSLSIPPFFFTPPSGRDAANQELTACIRYRLTKYRVEQMFFFLRIYSLVAKKKSSLGNNRRKMGKEGCSVIIVANNSIERR